MMFQKSVELNPNGNLNTPGYLNNLGCALFHRFTQLGDISDINKAVLMDEQALKLTPDSHPNKPRGFKSLGISLLCRFEQLGISVTSTNQY
ncbi:hypothetical protein C8R44DRAFT_787301 [Mycena epipterygia]|nr:hypothetical protein C8R44DRAFT_787301 [Mycena epipterygia]